MLSINAYSIQAPWYVDQIELRERQHAANKRADTKEVVDFLVLRSEADYVVQSRDCWLVQDWKLTVNVTAVTRSKIGFKPGDKIEIKYRVKYKVCPGGVSYSAHGMDPGSKSTAYLVCEGRLCGLAAGAWSFENEDKFTKTIKELESKVQQWKDKGMLK